MTDEVQIGDVMLSFPPDMGQPMKQTVVSTQGGQLVATQDFLSEAEYRLFMGPIMTNERYWGNG